MSYETASTIAGLVATNPASGDSVSQGDDHLRLIKAVLKAQFPGAASGGFAIPITATEAELNYVHGVTSAIQTQLNGVIPIGGIIVWSGITAPTNWRLCDGTNGSPNLTGKFVMGWGSGWGLAATGGSPDAVVVSHTHTAVSTGSINLNTGIQSNNHKHPFTTNETNTDHLHTYLETSTTGQQAATQGGGISVGKDWRTSSGMDRSQAHSHVGLTDDDDVHHTHPVNGAGSVTTTIAATGGTAVNLNLPPFYVLAYIQRYQ
jgi:microcystin-dependent protein